MHKQTYRIHANKEVDIEAMGAEDAAELWAKSNMWMYEPEDKEQVYVSRIMPDGSLTEFCSVMIVVERAFKATRVNIV